MKKKNDTGTGEMVGVQVRQYRSSGQQGDDHMTGQWGVCFYIFVNICLKFSIIKTCLMLINFFQAMFFFNIIYAFVSVLSFQIVFMPHVIIFKIMVVFIYYCKVYTHTYFEMSVQYPFLPCDQQHTVEPFICRAFFKHQIYYLWL